MIPKEIRKKRVVLVNPGIDFLRVQRAGMFPNTAIMILSTILVNNDFDVAVVDGRYLTYEATIKRLSELIDDKLIFIGFSVMTLQVPWSYRVSCKIKELYPKVKIVWGGTHPTLFPEETVHDDAVDIVMVNDAASTVASLAQTLALDRDLSNVAGICYTDNNKIYKTQPNLVRDDFSNIPYVNFDIFNHKLYSRNNNIAIEPFYLGEYSDSIVYPIITGLGCAYKCTFCINTILERDYRYRSAGEIIERIKFLKSKYGANFIHPMDENFFINKKRIYEFVDLLDKEDLHIKWRPQLRADYFSKDYIDVNLARRLDRSGMVVAAMGVESASQQMLDKLNKHLKVEQIMEGLKIISRTNIIPKMNFMVGLPGESEEEIRKTYHMACQIRKEFKKSCITVTAFRLYPGSLLYNQAILEYGYKPPSSLNEWAAKGVRELGENVGYESRRSYKWIKNPKKFEGMRVAYDFISMDRLRYRIIYRILCKIAFMRFKRDFFAFIWIEKTAIGFFRIARDYIKLSGHHRSELR